MLGKVGRVGLEDVGRLGGERERERNGEESEVEVDSDEVGADGPDGEAVAELEVLGADVDPAGDVDASEEDGEVPPEDVDGLVSEAVLAVEVVV